MDNFLSWGQLESLSLDKFYISWIQNNNMPRGFFGNLIFAIIARMLCGNHLKCLVCTLLMLGSTSSENGNTPQPVLTYACQHHVRVYTRLNEFTQSFLLFMSLVIPSFFLFSAVLWSAAFLPFLRSPLSHSSCSLRSNQLHHINHLIMEVAIPQ